MKSIDKCESCGGKSYYLAVDFVRKPYDEDDYDFVLERVCEDCGEVKRLGTYDSYGWAMEAMNELS